MIETTHKQQLEPPAIPLEQNEHIIYTEETSPKLSAAMTSVGLIAFFGFPFYAWLFFIVAGGTFGGVALKDQLTLCIEPASILTVVIILGALAPQLLKLTVKAWMPDLCQLVVTNKRIFQLSAKTNKLTGEFDPPLIMTESRYEETLAINIPSHGKNRFLTFKLIHKPDDDSDSKSLNTYGVTNAERVYSRLPLELTQEKGIRSQNGQKFISNERRNQFTGSVAGLLLLGGLIYLSSILVPQEIATHYLRESRKAYLQGDYKAAEIAGQSALAYLKTHPNHPFAGPINYRLAIAYKKNGKYAQAIPLLKEAILKCDWEDSESIVNWRPAIFRSNIYLGEIYAKLGKNAEATQAFDSALMTMSKETSRKKVDRYTETAVKFYVSQGDHEKAAAFMAAAHRFQPLNHHIRAFDQ